MRLEIGKINGFVIELCLVVIGVPFGLSFCLLYQGIVIKGEIRLLDYGLRVDSSGRRGSEEFSGCFIVNVGHYK